MGKTANDRVAMLCGVGPAEGISEPLDGNGAYAQDLDYAKGVYAAYRGQIEHENSLVSARSSWLLISQSFLVPGFCILNAVNPRNPQTPLPYALAATTLPFLGFLSVVPILTAIVGGLRAMRMLRRRFEVVRSTLRAMDTISRDYPSVQAYGRNTFFGHSATIALPVLFLVFWGMIVLAEASASFY